MVRRARLFYLDKAGDRRLSFAERAVQTALQDSRSVPAGTTPLWIDYSVRFRQIASISWKDVPGRLRTTPEFFETGWLSQGQTLRATATNIVYRESRARLWCRDNSWRRSSRTRSWRPTLFTTSPCSGLRPWLRSCVLS